MDMEQAIVATARPEELFTYRFDDLFEPTLKALRALGGSGSVDEIEEEVARALNLSEDQVNEIHRDNRTKLSYRLAWARNYLKRIGFLENSSRGIWALTPIGQTATIVNKTRIKREVLQKDKKKLETAVPVPIEEQIQQEEVQQYSWKDELIETVLSIEPPAFERLCQRLLRELGFMNVEVTGRSNDGGIDGKGLLKVGTVLSFHVIFQAKRFRGSVSPSIVRDFRGAMVGRADKGLIITTGTFSREAKREASRDGAPPIDLIDGNDLAENLQRLRLGVDVELVEKVTVKRDWFQKI